MGLNILKCHDHGKETEAAWDRNASEVKEIKNGAGRYFDGLQDLYLAIKPDLASGEAEDLFRSLPVGHASVEQLVGIYACTCMDERVRGGQERDPGSGILTVLGKIDIFVSEATFLQRLTGDEGTDALQDTGLDHLVSEVLAEAAKVVAGRLFDERGANLGLEDKQTFVLTCHQHCGAGGVFTNALQAAIAKEFKTKLPGVEAAEIDKKLEQYFLGKSDMVAKEYVEKVVEKLREKELTIRVEAGFVPEEKMDMGGIHGHWARVIYFDKVGGFTPQAIAGVPGGFVVSERSGNEMYNLALALKIAFGDHGFGDKFTSAEPMLLLAVCERGSAVMNTANELERELKKDLFAKELIESGRVKVDGFVV